MVEPLLKNPPLFCSCSVYACSAVVCMCLSRLLANLQQGEQYLKSLQAAVDSFSVCDLPYEHAEALFCLASLKVGPFLPTLSPLFTFVGLFNVSLHIMCLLRWMFVCSNDLFILQALPSRTSAVSHALLLHHFS
jgi:hypothetical protein